MSDINVGIDLGGSHVAIGVVNNEGKILEQFEKDFTIKEKENVLPVAIRYIVDTLRELKQWPARIWIRNGRSNIKWSYFKVC